jgi:hypothetical protein
MRQAFLEGVGIALIHQQLVLARDHGVLPDELTKLGDHPGGNRNALGGRHASRLGGVFSACPDSTRRLRGNLRLP